MRINTYNAEFYSLPESWTKAHGVQSNFVLFDYRDGKMEVDDYDFPEKEAILKNAVIIND